MADHDYDEGLREGRLKALERIQTDHHARLDHHERRLQFMERCVWGLLGAIALAEFLPTIREFLNGAG